MGQRPILPGWLLGQSAHRSASGHSGEQAGAETELGPLLSPLHPTSLPTAVIDLGFLAQIGFLFGLNSIPHPACEEALGQGAGGGQGVSLGRED